MKYKCPKCGMVYDKPGKCTMDGEKLVETKEDDSSSKHMDHSEHHKHMMHDFKNRFFISAVLTIPILILSPLIQNFLGYTLTFAGDKYILLILSTIIFFYGGLPFLKGLYSELRTRNPGMMTLIAIAISVAYFYSAAVVFGLKGKFFFWELATLIDVMLFGHWIEMKSVLGASKALEKLAELMPDSANIIINGKIKIIKISQIKKGDLILVKAGEKIPADGVISKGESHIDESMLTGESKPANKKINDKVIGGSVNGDGVLEIKVIGTGEESYLNKVINLVKDAQSAKSKTQRLADVAAMWLTIVAISVGFITLVTWLKYGPNIAFAIERMATVMVITCPHALGLAIPLVTAVSTSLSAKNGLLIRNRTSFENSRKISTIVFDKTGTLTKGKFGVSLVKSLSKDFNKDKILQYAVSLEKLSEHPIARSILTHSKNVKSIASRDIKIIKGEGLQGKINNQTVEILSPFGLKKRKILVPKNSSTSTDIYLVVDNKLKGSISLEDEIREESYETIQLLQKQGIKCWMLTGDNKTVAKNVAEKLKLDGYYAEVLPHQKLEKIKELQEQGEFVAMTGDGINDAPALAQADVGIAIGSGTDVAAETADIILVNSNPRDVLNLILFGKATYNKMVQNLFWATGYNIFAIPLAAGALYSYGILISPAVGAALMSLSTVIVAVNAKFLNLNQKK